MSETADLTNNSKQKLVSDMKVVVSDAEEILRATAGVAGGPALARAGVGRVAVGA